MGEPRASHFCYLQRLCEPGRGPGLTILSVQQSALHAEDELHDGCLLLELLYLSVDPCEKSAR